MTTLAEMQFEELRAGMKFRHGEHGEQVVLDLGRGQLGLIIRFHDCSMYNGQMPTLEDEGEISVFQLLAENTFPHGAEKWELLSEVEPEEVAACGWSWFRVSCPHCSFDHRFLAAEPTTESRQCRSCGMVFTNPPEEDNP